MISKIQNDKKLMGHGLPPGTILKDSYQIEEVLGEGGFGITYAGLHISMNKPIAIKEFFPSNKAARDTDSLVVVPHSRYEKEYVKGYQHFLEEAKLLQNLSGLDGIVQIYDEFKENGTAYIVMEYIDGITLEQFVQENGVFTPEEVLDLFLPVISVLGAVHETGLIHRDISPDNLLLGTDNKLHLIDFGAAGMETIYHSSHNTIILKNGYAPPEQYLPKEKQGAWLDVYALCATMYFALTKITPQISLSRTQDDTLKPLSMLMDIPAFMSAAIEKGLQPYPADRYRDMNSLYQALTSPKAIEKNTTILCKTPSLHLRFYWFYKQNPGKVLFSSVLLVVLLFAIAGITASSLNHNTREKQESGQAINATEKIQLSTESSPSPSPEATPSDKPADNTMDSLPELLSMPDLCGKNEKKARSTLKELDSSIQIKVKRAYSNKVATGKIISQSVMKGTTFSSGTLSTITLVISRGNKPVSSPEPSPTPVPGQTSKTPSPEKEKTASDTKDTSENTGGYQVQPDKTDGEKYHVDSE